LEEEEVGEGGEEGDLNKGGEMGGGVEREEGEGDDDV